MSTSPALKASQYALTSVELAVLDAVKQHTSPKVALNCDVLQRLTGYSIEQIQAITHSLQEKGLLREQHIPCRLI
jgi:hypothetical protein